MNNGGINVFIDGVDIYWDSCCYYVDFKFICFKGKMVYVYFFYCVCKYVLKIFFYKC